MTILRWDDTQFILVRCSPGQLNLITARFEAVAPRARVVMRGKKLRAVDLYVGMSAPSNG
jgi:hypothetical protein